MAKNRISYSLIGLFLIIAISCQKEDKVYPKVSIIQPSSPASYSYGDTLLVEVEVDDMDGPLLVSLLDGDKTVSPGFTKQKVQGRIHFFQAIFDDPNLEGGRYNIRVLAYNGNNRSADFQNITYQIAPRTSLGFALLMDDSGQKQLGFLSRSGSFSQTVLNGDYPHLAVSSSLGYLFTAPEYSGKLTAYDRFLNNIYDVSNPAPGGALQYRQLLGDGQMVYALDNEGYIRAYQSSGSPVRNYQLDLGRIPIRGAINADGEFLVAAAEPGFNSYKLLLMNPVNGFVLKVENLPEFPMGVAYDSYDFYVLCAEGGSSVLFKYTPSTGIIQEWARIENENPVDIAGDG